jgi:flagellar biosynthesis GTPase FlhF
VVVVATKRGAYSYHSSPVSSLIFLSVEKIWFWDPRYVVHKCSVLPRAHTAYKRASTPESKRARQRAHQRASTPESKHTLQRASAPKQAHQRASTPESKHTSEQQAHTNQAQKRAESKHTLTNRTREQRASTPERHHTTGTLPHHIETLPPESKLTARE